MVEDSSGNTLSGRKATSTRTQIDSAVESYGDIIRAYKEGRGPMYMSCLNTSKEDFDYMCWALSNEGNQVLLQQFRESGLDPMKTRIEFSAYEPEITGGYAPTVQGETNVPGLLAAGGEVVGSMKRSVSPGSYVFGKLVGEHAANIAKDTDFADMSIFDDLIAFQKDRLAGIRKRTQGASWQEASGTCQDIMSYYCCEYKYESLLDAGLEQLSRVRRRAEFTLAAADQHELGRCLEAFNLMDIAEAALRTSKERKETRLDRYDPFKRVDYDTENPDMAKFLLYSISDGKPNFRWRAPHTLD